MIACISILVPIFALILSIYIYFKNSFNNLINNINNNTPKDEYLSIIEQIIKDPNLTEYVNNLGLNHNNNFKKYLGFIYEILLLIDTLKFSVFTKKYIRILKYHLPDNALTLISLFCLENKKQQYLPKFEKLWTKYAMLSDLYIPINADINILNDELFDEYKNYFECFATYKVNTKNLFTLITDELGKNVIKGNTAYAKFINEEKP